MINPAERRRHQQRSESIDQKQKKHTTAENNQQAPASRRDGNLRQGPWHNENGRNIAGFAGGRNAGLPLTTKAFAPNNDMREYAFGFNAVATITNIID